ncbi:unnamed protein product, partial [Pipistrellus nathusii]
KRKRLQFKATCTNVTYKPLKYPDGSFLLHHTFSNCFLKAGKREMKDDCLAGTRKRGLEGFVVPLPHPKVMCRNEETPATGEVGLKVRK